MQCRIWGIVIGTFCFPTIAYANTQMIDIRGFGTLSGVYSDSESLAFRRDMTQEGRARQFSLSQDSLLGVQADILFTDALKASVQIVGKDRINNSLDESITWANLSYDFNNSWNVRVGRIGSDLTLIGDVGNIGYAYEWVRPPVDFYGAIPFYHFDGAELLYRHSFEQGNLSAKIFYGRSSSSFKYKTSESEFDLSPFSGLALRYENGGLTLRTAYARTEIDSLQQSGIDNLRTLLRTYSFIPGVNETLSQLDIKHSPIDYYTAGAVYRYNSWKWLAEVSYMDTDMATVLPSLSAYAGVVKRFDDFAVFGLLAHTHTTRSTYSANAQLPEPLLSYVQTGLNSTDFEQKTASVGIRWDVATNMALKAQWDRAWVAANQDLLWDGKSVTSDEQVNIFTLSMNFIF